MMIKKLVLILTTLFLLNDVSAVQVKVALPYNVPDESIHPLRTLVNPDLQKLMETELNKRKTWARLITQKKLCVGLVDLSDPLNVQFARVNGNIMMYAASLPKIAILLAAFESFEDGSLKETPEIMKDLHLMIARSDNACATRMIERIGPEKIKAVLISPRYNFYDEEYGGGLWVGKKYAKQSRRYPEPMKGLVHAATATQVCRFYYLMAMGKLVSRERSKQMLDIMANPEISHKFVFALHKRAPEAMLYRKSGTWKTLHSDSVLVWGPVWRRYIAVALTEDKNGEKILRDLIPALEDVLRTHHNLNPATY